MAKEKIPENIQRKFDKPQFRQGDAVFFSWLGQKKYGYVTKLKTTGWGIQYMVKSAEGPSYPCGMQIKGQKTHYNTGFIWYEDTISIGSEELIRRIKNHKNESRVTIIRGNPGGTASSEALKSGGRNTSKRTDDAKHSNAATQNTSKRVSKKSNDRAGDKTAGRKHSTKRGDSKNSELDAAIAKQRSFLDFTRPQK